MSGGIVGTDMLTLRERQSVFASYVGQLLTKATELGTPVVVLEWYRSKERQQYLVSIGRSRTLNSKHIDGLAVDLCFLADLKDDGQMNWTADKYRHLGVYWESLDPKNHWGGGWQTFVDAPHFEYGG
ncbi:MAG: M15 family metallopeptidase [Nitrospirae bacterium]|nr:M15 family metallopeptidase [Nitrospirota bacterium]